MATRKRTARKAPAKRSNSNITAAQKATSDARKARAAAAQAKAEQGQKGGAAPAKGSLPPDKQNSTLSAGNPPLTDPKAQAAQDSIAGRNSSTLTKSTLQQNIRPAGTSSADKTFAAGQQAAAKTANLLAGLSMTQQQSQQKNPLTNPALYGTNDAKRSQNITERAQAYAEAQRQATLKAKGQVVWMGMKAGKIRNSGPERFDEGGGDTTPTQLPDVKTKDELMSWLADEKTFNQIKKRMTDSGIAVQSYDDVAKLWQNVVDQAAATYTSTGKQVTPWALISLRGKSMVNGRPAPKTTTSTSIEEMDPAQAKVMIKNSLSQLLGRDPKQNEIEDFVAKAQTIARQNPNITKTTTQYDIAGTPISQSSVSSGGQDVVTAKAQLAAEEQAKQSEDYAAYQGAGVYMPWLMDALSAPV